MNLLAASGDSHRFDNRQINVLHIAAGKLYGGIEAYLATVARLGQGESGLRHAFAVCYSGRLSDELDKAQGELYDLGPARMSRPWSVRRSRKRLDRIIREKCFDIAITHGSWPQLMFGSTAKRAGAQLTYFIHDNLEKPSWIDRFAAQTTPDLVLANCHFTLAGARRLYRNSPAEVCSYAIEAGNAVPSARVEVRRELGVAQDRVIVIHASRLERWKGHATLIEAMGRLRNLPNWELWVAGGAQRPHEIGYLHELEVAARRLSIDSHVRFLGQRNDVRRLLAAADIFCQPNVEPEPFGIVFIEALYAGLPVVTSDFGGAKEILSGTTGVLLPPGDVETLANKLQQLIEDPELRRRAAIGGPSRAAELCDPAQHFQKLFRLISPTLPKAS